MKLKILFLTVIAFMFFKTYAQFEKITDTEYFMSFEPVVGSLKGTSNIANGVNPNLTLKSQGLLLGVDWVSSRWVNVDGKFLVPKLQIPIKVRTMRGKDMKGLKTSDGTYFPEQARPDPKDKPWAPFNYLDFSIDLYYSPFYLRSNNFLITPKFGIGVDIAKHEYNIDLSKYLGKQGTDSTLSTTINASYSPFYSYTFWEDLYGIKLGTYINVGSRIFIDAGWEYNPGRLMTKAMKNTINSNWNAMPGTAKSVSSKLSKLTLKGQIRIISWFSLFVKYEYSNYKFEGPIIGGDQKFYQKYSNLLFGVTLGGPKM